MSFPEPMARPRPRQRIVEDRKTVAHLIPHDGQFFVLLGDSDRYIATVSHPQEALPAIKAFFERIDAMRVAYAAQSAWLRADEADFERRRDKQEPVTLEARIALDDRWRDLDNAERYMDDCDYYRPASLKKPSD